MLWRQATLFRWLCSENLHMCFNPLEAAPPMATTADGAWRESGKTRCREADFFFYLSPVHIGVKGT